MSAKININGQTLEGFERGDVTLTMEEAANTFNFEYVADGKTPGARAIYAGDVCSIVLEDGDVKEAVLVGYVQATDDEDTADWIQLTATGASKTMDLARCSELTPAGRWTNATVDTIAKQICEPFAIEAFVEVTGLDPLSHSTQKGETALDSIARICLKRGLIPYCTGGDLILARAGSSRTATTLRRGDGRLMRSSRTDSWEGRYSQYVFRGQARSTDENSGANASQLKHAVTDPAITRYLPLLVQAEAHDVIDLQTRALLERNQRAGRGERITATVNGWATDEGTIWRPNTLVKFASPVLGVDAELLIVSARFRFGANEPLETELTLCRPEAFDTAAEYVSAARGKTWT